MSPTVHGHFERSQSCVYSTLSPRSSVTGEFMAQYTKVPEHPHSENPLLPLITDPSDPLAPIALRSTTLEPNDDIFQGPLEKVYLFWIVGASCDGCTISVTGATHPRLEDLLLGRVARPAPCRAHPHRRVGRVGSGVDREPANGCGRRTRRPLPDLLGGLDHGRDLLGRRVLDGPRRGPRNREAESPASSGSIAWRPRLPRSLRSALAQPGAESRPRRTTRPTPRV